TATGSLHGMTRASMTRENLARAAVEGMMCHLAEGMAAVQAQGVEVRRISLIGGAARSAAVQQVAPAVLGQDVELPEPGEWGRDGEVPGADEYAADAGARQAAWVLSGAEQPPVWEREGTRVLSAEPTPEVLAAYRAESARAVERFTA